MAQPDPCPFNQGKELQFLGLDDEAEQEPDFTLLDDIKIADGNDEDGQENLLESDGENNTRR